MGRIAVTTFHMTPSNGQRADGLVPPPPGPSIVPDATRKVCAARH